MRYLTPEHWQPFMKADGRFDGVKFEKLVATLLPKLYPGKWHPTKYSWDGKKDFYQQKGAERRWAECKAYSKPISINIISPTLIMAMLDDAQVILLFSHSPINKNAQLYLGQFASLTSRTIRVYDDETLEHLILTHADLNKFFPTASQADLTVHRHIVTQARLSQDPDIEYQMDGGLEQDEQDLYLNLLSTFSVDVLVRNSSVNSAPISGRICLNPDDLVKRFWLFNREIESDDPAVSFTLDSGESFFQRFYFRARLSGRLRAPHVAVEVEGEPLEVLHLDPIEVSSILAVPLIGVRQNAALALFRHSVSARDKPVFFHVYGQSGTGKSRLLREFRDELLGRGYLVFVFNGEDERNSSFDHFVRRLASTICKLPMLDRVVRPTAADSGFESEESGRMILNLLYCDSSRPSQNREQSCGTILELLATRKAAIVIDNMQFLDADTIALINTALTETTGAAARTVWVLGLNTDVVTSEMPAANLSSRLRMRAAEETDSVFAIQVEGFTKEDALHYLDEALAGHSSEADDERFTMTHPETAYLIINRVGTRPLFMEQALQHAVDRGGLGLRDGRLYVTDIEQFHGAINGLPGRIRELIAKRWDFVRERLQKGATLLVQSLAELISMPMLIAQRLGIQRDDIHTLVNLGIVDITESNEVRFHHRQHYLFFADLYHKTDPEFAQYLLEAIAAAGYSDIYPFQAITLRETIGTLQDEDLRKIAAIVLERSIMGAARQRATPVLLEIFNRPRVAVDPGTELRVVNTLCQELKRHVAFETAAKAFDNAHAVRLSRRAYYLAYGEDYYNFVHNHVNSFFALHRDGEALPLIESALQELEQFNFATDEARLLAQGKLLNRRSVSLKTINDLTAAEHSVRESLVIAQALDDVRLIYKNFIDWGYIYHGFNRYNDELIQKWGAALAVFENNSASNRAIQDERASMLLHSGELEILAKRRSEAIEIIEEGIRYSRRTLTPFHEVKLLLLRVVAELAWGGECDPKTLMHWVDTAQDRAVTTRAQRSYWVVFYTRAKLHCLIGDKDKIKSNFLSALEQLAKILTDSRMEERHEPFFEDLALNMRMVGYTLSKQDIGQIRNARIRKAVGSILALESSAFNDWLAGYLPSATFHDGRYNLPVP
jgi:hypothetical protein